MKKKDSELFKPLVATAEKYLKGFLAWYQVPFIKTHDLLELLKQVRQIVGPAADELSPELFLLDQYSVEVRYPQEYAESLGEQEVREAVAAAYTTRAWVRCDRFSELP
jgi:HEPN domain-containing protein